LSGCGVVLRDGSPGRVARVILLALAVAQALAWLATTPATAATAGSQGISSIEAVRLPYSVGGGEPAMCAGARDAAITVTAVEGTGATIDPSEAHYDLGRPSDVLTTITWNDAGAVSSIVDGEGGILARGIDYVLGSLSDRATLAIPGAYIGNRLLEVGDELQLTVNFDAYASVLFTIRAVSEDAFPQHTLMVVTTTGGSVIEPGVGVFTYAADTVVELVATAHEGYRFSGWSGDVGSVSQVGAASTSIRIDGSYNITASFAAEIRQPVTNRPAIAGIIAAAVAGILGAVVVRRRRTARTGEQ